MSTSAATTLFGDRLGRRRSYGFVLLLVSATIVFQMSAWRSDAALLITLLLQSATLVVVVATAGAQRTVVRAAAALAALLALAALVTWAVRGDIPPAPVAIVNGLLVGLAPVVIAGGLLRSLRADGAVTIQTLSGVLAIYLLLGLLFAFGYTVVEAVDSRAIFAGVAETTSSDRLYFSFVTLCTVGFGDLTPGTDLMRSFAVTEMLFGQIYLVTVVSVIVGNLARRRD